MLICQDGLLPSAFMIGLLIASPIFASAGKKYNALRLVGVGLSIFVIATLGCSLAWGFLPLLISRALVGIAEASFIAYASPFIDDHAPGHAKARWLAIFGLCVPVGYAFGYIFGGLLSSALHSWRSVFLLESLLMTPVAVFCLTATPIDLRCAHEKVEFQNSRELFSDLRHLFHLRLYTISVLALTIWVASIGTLAYYGPLAAKQVFNIDATVADMSFGIVTVVCGVCGSLIGGWALDSMGSTLKNSCLLCAGASGVGGLLFLAAFFAPNFPLFIILLTGAELFLFSAQAPSNALCLWTVPTSMRPLAMATSIVCMHVLGDVPAPPLVGYIQGIVKNWRITLGGVGLLLEGSALAYFIGFVNSETAFDYRIVGDM